MATRDEVRELLEKVVDDTKITAQQVDILEDFVRKDWVIDQDEGKLLFRVNKALGSNHDDSPEWTSFFVTSICRLVVMDMNSPGEITEEEGDWLGEMFDNYAVDNVSEIELLKEIAKTTSVVNGKIAERMK